VINKIAINAKVLKLVCYLDLHDQTINTMLKKGEHVEGTPVELQVLLDRDVEANDFFESLSKSYKQGYCDWVGSAKQEYTRKVRADKAMTMLRNKQKTLKT
jgi:uncharacterized protein YdeI (YjbR/CyaY-like superfamily)